jgi:hypothetical protein
MKHRFQHPFRSASLMAVLALGLVTGMSGVMAADPKAPPDTLPEMRFEPVEEDLSGFTNRQLADKAQKLVAQMDKQLTESFYLLEASLSAGDLAAASARNEAITVMKGLLKLAEGNLRTLKQRVAEDDRPRVENEYVKITIAASKVQEYYAQVRSAASVGLEDFEGGTVERRLTFSGRLPVLEELPRMFLPDFFNPFSSTPLPPVNASPWF